MRKSGESWAIASVTTESGIRSSASISADRRPVEECFSAAASCQSSMSSPKPSWGWRCFLR